MRRIRSASVAMAALLQLLICAAAPAQSLNEVLDGVSRSVKEFQDLLPDFVCREKIISTELDSGNTIKEKAVESIFTGIQRSSGENRGHFGFTESREVVAIDEKPVPKGTAFPKLPYRFAGGYSSLLVSTFAPDNLPIHNYTIADSYDSGNSRALLVRFATKENQRKLSSLFQGTELLAKDNGAAWIDPKSLRVLRLQRRSLNLPASLSRSIATVDYGPVSIGGSEFWMPIRIQAEANERNSQVTLRYVAEYADCRKFMADIKLLQ